MKRQTVFKLLATLALGLGMGLSAQAQEKAPIKILVGFPPGGSTDLVARLLAEKMSVVLKQPIIVDNKPGAGGRMAAQALKASAPDGLTYMIAPNATPVLQTLLYPVEVLKYDMLKDLTPVAVLVTYPLAIAVNTQSGVKNIKEYAAWVKANPKEASFGTAGAGGHTHFSGLQLGKAIGQPLQVVPYRGNGPMVTDLLGGQIDFGVVALPSVAQHIKSGALRAIGMCADKRTQAAPDIPTFIEQGLTGYNMEAWFAVVGPKGMTPAQVKKVHDAVTLAFSDATVKDTMAKQGNTINISSAEHAQKTFRSEMARYAALVKKAGIEPQ